MTAKIGFIGLGIMGSCMAANILSRGFDLIVWNRTSSKIDDFVRKGARGAQSPADVAAVSSIVLICVTDEKAVQHVLFGPQGVVEGARPETLVIDMSTIAPQASSGHAETLAAHGLSMLDAPVSGSKEGAEKGTLSIMVGGAKSEFERAYSVFQGLGSNIVHVGERCGDGQTVKLVNQLLAAGNTLVMCEALLFAQAAGVDLEKTLEAVSGGAAGSWMLSQRGPQVIRRDWQPGFTIDLQLKSISTVLKTAADNGVPVPLMAQLYQYYQTLQAQGHGQEGHHALIKAFENMAGFKVGPVSLKDD